MSLPADSGPADSGRARLKNLYMPDIKPSNTKSTLVKGFGFIILAIVIMAIVWFQMMTENQTKIEKILDEQNDSRAIFTMRDAAYQRALILHRMALLKDEFDRDEEYIQLKEKAGDFIKAREAFLKSMKAGSFPKELAIWEQALPHIRKGSRVQAEAAEYLLNDETKMANEKLLNEVVPTQNHVMDNLTKLLEQQRIVTKQTVEQISHQNQSGLIIMTILAAWAIIWSLGIGLYTIRKTSRIEKSLLVARQKAQDADKLKSQFLANMSHEIRTPLTAIIGYSEMLIESRKNFPEWEEYISRIISNGKHLNQLINDILDLSKIEARQLNIETISVSLCELVVEIESLMGDRAQTKGLDFKIDYRFPIPKTIHSDPTRLKQILINLCNNAIKFTAEGNITLTISYDKTNDIISFTVNDTGIGMTQEQSAQLFKPFKQVDTSTTRKFGGTGLGLYISRQLSELLGGNLSVESQTGVGSTFTAHVKANLESNTQWINSADEVYSSVSLDKPEATAPTLHGKILLAEDNPDNQALISMHIKKTGAALKIVENGRQAVDVALSEHFDLVLMDMQMPIMGGIEAIKTLRDKQYKTPIAILTANAMKEDIIASQKVGANDFLTKPIDQKIFFNVLAKYLPSDIEKQTQPNKPETESMPELDDISDLVDMYISKLPETCSLIQKLVNAQEWVKVGSEIHQLKGTGGAFGLPEITEHCITIEQQIVAKDYGAAQKLIKQFEEICMGIVDQHSPASHT